MNESKRLCLELMYFPWKKETRMNKLKRSIYMKTRLKGHPMAGMDSCYRQLCTIAGGTLVLFVILIMLRSFYNKYTKNQSGCTLQTSNISSLIERPRRPRRDS